MAAQLAVRFLTSDQAVGNDHNGVRDGQEGLLLTPAHRQAMVLGRQIGVLGAGRRMGRLQRGHSQGPIPRARLPGQPLPRTLVVPRSDPLCWLLSRRVLTITVEAYHLKTHDPGPISNEQSSQYGCCPNDAEP